MNGVIGKDDYDTEIVLKYGNELFPGFPVVVLSTERKILTRDFLKLVVKIVTPKFWG